MEIYILHLGREWKVNVEVDVVRQSIELLSKPENFKKIEYKVSNESAWEVGLACGGEIAIFLEKIH